MASTPRAEFDSFAKEYDNALNEGLAISGEGKEYFASARAAWLGRRLEQVEHRPVTALDYGCGTGTATPFLFDHINSLESLTGVDVSVRSIDVARQDFGSDRVAFAALDDFEARADIDLAFCNGVFSTLR